MTIVKRKIVIEGAHRGKDITLAGVEFKGGEAVLQGALAEVEGLYTYLHRCWQVNWADQPTVTSGKPVEEPTEPPKANERLLAAIKELDPTDDNHWTQQGKPALSAIGSFYGSTDFTRADVDAAAPGYDRDAATQPNGG